VFADIDPATCNLEPQAVAAAITSRTRAIVPAHMYGQMADMPGLMTVAASQGVPIIEDADQAIGAACQDPKTGRWQQAGTWGMAGTTSFYPTKSLSAMGDAGAVLTADAEFAAKLRALRVHGLEAGFTIRELGGNFRLDAIQAALLSIKLHDLHDEIERRRRIARLYDEALEELPVTTPSEAPGHRHSYNQYTIRVRGRGREALAAHLRAMGVECRVYYPRPLHLMPAFAAAGQAKVGCLPQAELACREVLSIPCHPTLANAEVERVVAAIRGYFEAA
jgi:dTDP-4-amino-4,6-dideoxygalactose transaminase